MSSIVKPAFGRQLNYGHPLAQGLVGCWLMNEGSGDKVYDLSGNGNTGTCQNMTGTATSGWNPGKFGSALAFDGTNDHVDCGNNAALLPPSISMEVIITPYQTGDFRGIITNKQTSDGTDGINIHLASVNCLGALIGNGSGFTYLKTSWKRTAGVLYHIIVTHEIDNQNILYVQGKYENSVTFGLAYDAGAFTRMGMFYIVPSNHFYGIIHLARIYNRALSATEVSQLYQSPFAMFDQRRFWAVAAGGHVPYFLILKKRRAR